MTESTIKTRQFFRLQYSAAIRIWHWLLFLFIAASMVTVLFAENLFDEEGERPRSADQRIEQVRQDGDEGNGSKLSNTDTQRKAASLYRHRIWEAHEMIGYGLCILLLARIVIETRQANEARLLKRINAVASVPVTGKAEKSEKLHFLLSKWGYVVFYVLLLLMAFTGLILAFEDVASLKPIRRPAKEVHEILQYLMYGYVLAHLVGVVRADLKNQSGIVSAMINGGKTPGEKV